jgi:hypothetical protein
VCSRHCRALLRKQVLPELLKPRPTLVFAGQVVSIGPVCNGFWSEGPATPLFNACVFLSEGDNTATFLLNEGDCGGNVYNYVVNPARILSTYEGAEVARTASSRTLTSLFDRGEAFIGVYFVSSNIIPAEDPSTNSIGAGRRALKASRSFAGLHWISSPGWSGENGGAGWRGAASIVRTASWWLRREFRGDEGRALSLSFRALGRMADRGNRRGRRGRVKDCDGKIRIEKSNPTITYAHHTRSPTSDGEKEREKHSLVLPRGRHRA